ncbi:MAG: DUF3108 domain-containing protein [Nitrospira sp.]|nr:DUF3108 domain-containing protein [Nitrospira sp.]MBH0184489.1 DUF3108 domain-containing protein [Nitrospira sp.]
MRWHFVAALGLLSLSLPVQAADDAAVSTHPFRIGECLTYDVVWLRITAATAVMEIAGLERAEDRTLAKLVGTAQFRPILTAFFPVDNRVESEINFATLVPEHMTFRRLVDGFSWGGLVK